ncbi:VOC family protein [Methylosinus sp. Sm6]|uniref:2-oxoadipate dioxygenase/decarboxylase HglS n=1 Tax=Methylosinus sp. Sm6 TaxID=2866948 RepID=UPI001C992AFF|nr:VOC family protein [Methylosinus sp. Sm6]MBY6239944.1 VOC family protein [Methylosinus sp. Sm6]
MTQLVSADTIRAMFSAEMTQMYRAEVPQYQKLAHIVAEVDGRTLAADETLAERLRRAGRYDLIGVERHGAIRVGRPEELSGLRRLFAVMGMTPVGYYDLSPAGVPVHSTCFRPVTEQATRICPFRIFTSLLRPELIEDEALRREALAILERRRIFTPRCEHLIELHEAHGGLSEAQAMEFVHEAAETFRWHGQAKVSADVYRKFLAAHPLVADVVCFQGPHINHLTLPSLDIDAVQQSMVEHGLDPKAIVEGPPRRRAPILLRQTSFKAIEEKARFDGEEGAHKARFGEIEQRGAALTAAGRALYDELLAQTLAAAPPDKASPADYGAELARRFADFPDDAATLRARRLAFFRYAPAAGARMGAGRGGIDELIQAGLAQAEPIFYEDFLPVSAAGIFQSNLGEGGRRELAAGAARGAFEEALGATPADELALYAQSEEASIRATLEALGASATAV